MYQLWFGSIHRTRYKCIHKIYKIISKKEITLIHTVQMCRPLCHALGHSIFVAALGARHAGRHTLYWPLYLPLLPLFWTLFDCIGPNTSGICLVYCSKVHQYMTLHGNCSQCKDVNPSRHLLVGDGVICHLSFEGDIWPKTCHLVTLCHLLSWLL